MIIGALCDEPLRRKLERLEYVVDAEGKGPAYLAGRPERRPLGLGKSPLTQFTRR